MKELWLVGQHTSGLWNIRKNEYTMVAWDFQGVFSSQELAEAACKTSYYFVVPVNLDEQLPHDSVDWPGLYHPIQAEETP